ncbi:MAG: aminotransferase class I/II-fold pyridoxal phosphate-dependent enzyme [Actinomycetota bacterium]|nr:aminotransferase class I/II-fold pyridoxal phosphate-dependent enzyme [Actinomycetota bacterium]
MPIEDGSRLRSIKGMKWTKYPQDVLPAFVADMDFEPPQEVTEALEDMVRLRDFGYRFIDIDRLIPAWVNWQKTQHGLKVPVGDCKIFTSSIHALEAVMVLNTQEGDGVVLFSPVYHPFATAVSESGRRLVDVPLRESDWTIDMDRFRDSIDEKTRVVLFCQPHNPTGHIFSRTEIRDFAEVVIEKDLLVISDEIWADLIFDEMPHQPLGAHHNNLRDRTVTIGSASKSFNLAGARCSVAYIGDSATREKIDALPEHFLGQPSSFGAAATMAAWTFGENWLDETKEKLRINRDYVYEQFLNSSVRMDLPKATYLAWLDFSDTMIRENPSKSLLKEAKVALEPGSKFGSQSNSYARLNFATEPEILEQIIERVLSAI